MRYPWAKQQDGSWQQRVNKDSSGHENTYYEDKLGIQWDVSNSGFASGGCYNSCHLTIDVDSPIYPGKKYNNSPDEITDMWHWKSVRTEPNGQLDDKHVVYQDPESAAPNGRKSDSKTGGGYVDNNFGKFDSDCAADPTGALSLPCFMGPAGAELAADDKTWILDSEKQAFVDSFAAGDLVAGMVTSPFVGSRGDVSTAASYDSGVWTLEIQRSLTTTAGEDEDVQFDDLADTYYFGVAVFDNTQINHAVHANSLTFRFRP
jgi:hypothetical protein